MQTQVIICDKQIVYAMGSSLLIKDNPQLLGYHIIKTIEELNGYIAYDKNIQVLPMVLVVDSAMLHFGNPSSMHQLKEIKNRKRSGGVGSKKIRIGNSRGRI
jgi:hypothetical protein